MAEGALTAGESTTVILDDRVAQVIVSAAGGELWVTTDGSTPDQPKAGTVRVIPQRSPQSIPVTGSADPTVVKLRSPNGAGYTVIAGPQTDADSAAGMGAPAQSGASALEVKRARYKQINMSADAVDPEWFVFSWVHFSGDEGILDLTDPQAPLAVEDGLYTVTLSAYANGLTGAEFLFVEADAGGASSSSSFPVGPAGLTPGGTVSVAYFVAAGQSFLAAIQHDHATALVCGMSAYVTFTPATVAP